ncbi:uncharacterized protein [Leptinotarsa decemlineata]|uniref:uncharacterized protein n=1 Tax=Leptinotarsa decemlineata TaxID=7539 RepID=UPI003D308BB0
MKLLVSAIVLLSAQAFGGYVFPEDFQTCGRDDPNLDECILNAIRDAWPKLAEGISSPIVLKTEPVTFPFYEYHPDNDALWFNDYSQNIEHTGFNNSQILNASVDLATLSLNFTTFSPHVVQTSDYMAGGSVWYNKTGPGDRIWGRGKAVKEIYNTTILHQIRSVKYEKNEESYLRVDSYEVSISFDFVTLDYQNLFNGSQPEIAKTAGDFINASATYIATDQKPYIEDFLGKMFIVYAKKLIGCVPIDTLIH